jgi:2-haloacid dehalogenase
VAERWATFDCYGTLVDWLSGMRTELERLFGLEHADELLARYHELEPEIQAQSPGLSYREVLTIGLERLADEQGMSLPEGETSSLARALPGWPVFPEVSAALKEARRRGWHLGVLSNTDRDLIDTSMVAIGIAFHPIVVASEIGSYKPAPRHWEVFRDLTDADPEHHVHVAQSLYHDIGPATELGLRSIWINRLGEPEDDRPAKTLPDLSGLPDALDELVAEPRKAGP